MKRFAAMLLVLSYFLSGCGIQIGSFFMGGSYFDTPNTAFNHDADIDPVTRETPKATTLIGVYPLSSNYALCMSLVDYEINGKTVRTMPTVMLMKTQNEEYQYLGECVNFETDVFYCTEDDEDTVFSDNINVEGKSYNFCFGLKTLFDKTKFSDDEYNFYDTSFDYENETIELTIAVSK